MTTAIQTTQSAEMITANFDIDTCKQYLYSMGLALDDKQATQFIEIAKAFQLNPFKREIYGIKYGSNFNIIVGYEVYIKRAEATGMLDGWRAWTEGSGSDMVAKIQIQRKGWAMAFEHEVIFSEYDQGNSMWKKKPVTMIKKVVIGQGMRLCFPVEMGGLPPMEEEIQVQAATIIEEPDRDDNATPETLSKLDDALGLVPADIHSQAKASIEKAPKPLSQDNAEKMIAWLHGQKHKAPQDCTPVDTEPAQGAPLMSQETRDTISEFMDDPNTPDDLITKANVILDNDKATDEAGRSFIGEMIDGIEANKTK